MRLDQRSAEAAAYRWMYSTPGWAKRRDRQLEKQPLCERCSRPGHPVPATVANHKIPHKGDRKLFFEGELESVCAPCHDGPIQREERLGFSPAVDAAGWPTDARHPAVKARGPQGGPVGPRG